MNGQCLKQSTKFRGSSSSLDELFHVVALLLVKWTIGRNDFKDLQIDDFYLTGTLVVIQAYEVSSSWLLEVQRGWGK